jgi:hypothetical protein
MKNLKHKSKYFFIFFIFTFIIGLSSFSLFATAFTNESELTVKSNWFYETIGSFQQADKKSWENNIKFASGGEDLLAFENHGIVSYNDTEVLYKATARFGFEMTAHTYVGYDDIYPNIDINEKHVERFFSIKRYYWNTMTWSFHDVSWSAINYGDVTQKHEYVGSVPVTVGIKDLTPPSGVIDLNGITFTIPGYKYNIIQAGVLQVRDGEVGSYNDYFTNVGEVDEGNVEFEALDDNFNAVEQNIIGYYQKQDLGWSAGIPERGRTLFQSYIDTDQEGTTYHSISTELDEPFTFPVAVNLQPEVFEYVQYNTITEAGIDYWAWGIYNGDIITWASPATRNVKRVVAVHTKNNFLHWDFYVDVELYATVPSTAQLTQSILEDPYLKCGDMVWDTSFTGEYHVSTPLTQHDPLEALGEYILGLFTGSFSWLIWLIIGVVGLYIFIKLGIPYLRLRMRRKGRKIK